MDSAISFPSTYPLDSDLSAVVDIDSAIQRLNNCGLAFSFTYVVTYVGTVKKEAFLQRNINLNWEAVYILYNSRLAIFHSCLLLGW